MERVSSVSDLKYILIIDYFPITKCPKIFYSFTVVFDQSD